MIKIEKIVGPIDWYKATVKTLKETVEFEGPPKTIEWHVNDYLFRNGHQIEDVIKIIRASDASRLIPDPLGVD